MPPHPMKSLLIALCFLAAPAGAAEPGALTKPFAKRAVTRLVDVIYAAVGGAESLPLSAPAKERYPELDTDKSGSLSRAELSEAMLNAKLRLSLRGAAADSKLAQKVVNFIDADDGIMGGQIRVNGEMMESVEAAKNLESGAWTVGAGFFSKTDGVPTLGIRQGAGGAELVLP